MGLGGITENMEGRFCLNPCVGFGPITGPNSPGLAGRIASEKGGVIGEVEFFPHDFGMKTAELSSRNAQAEPATPRLLVPDVKDMKLEQSLVEFDRGRGLAKAFNHSQVRLEKGTVDGLDHRCN